MLLSLKHPVYDPNNGVPFDSKRYSEQTVEYSSSMQNVHA